MPDSARQALSSWCEPAHHWLDILRLTLILQCQGPGPPHDARPAAGALQAEQLAQRPALAPCLAALAGTAFAAAPDRPAPARRSTACAGAPPDAGPAGGCAERAGSGPGPAPSAAPCGGACALGPAAAWRGGMGLGGPAGVHDAVQAHANGGGRWQACWARAPDGRMCPVWAVLPPGWQAPLRPPGGVCGQPPPPPHPPPGDPPQGPGSRLCQAAYASPPQPSARRQASPAPGRGASAAAETGADGSGGNRAAAARLRARLRAEATPAAGAPPGAAAGQARGEERASASARGGCPLAAATAADGAAQGAAAAGGPDPPGGAPGRPAGAVAAGTALAAGGAAAVSLSAAALPGTSSVLDSDTEAPMAAGGQVGAGASARNKRALGVAETGCSARGKRQRAGQRVDGDGGGGGAYGSGTRDGQSGGEAAGQGMAGAWAAAGGGDGAEEEAVPACLQVMPHAGSRAMLSRDLPGLHNLCGDAAQAFAGTPCESACALGAQPWHRRTSRKRPVTPSVHGGATYQPAPFDSMCGGTPVNVSL